MLFARKVQIYKNSHGGYDQISHALYNIHGWYRCCQAVSPTNGMGTRLMHNKRTQDTLCRYMRTQCVGTRGHNVHAQTRGHNMHAQHEDTMCMHYMRTHAEGTT